MTLHVAQWCDLLGQQTSAHASHDQRAARAYVFADLMVGCLFDHGMAVEMSSLMMSVAFGSSQTSSSRLHNPSEVWSVVHIAPRLIGLIHLLLVSQALFFPYAHLTR